MALLSTYMYECTTTVVRTHISETLTGENKEFLSNEGGNKKIKKFAWALEFDDSRQAITGPASDFF